MCDCVRLYIYIYIPTNSKKEREIREVRDIFFNYPQHLQKKIQLSGIGSRSSAAARARRAGARRRGPPGRAYCCRGVPFVGTVVCSK